MPQEPKRRHSKARKRTRRASIALSSLGLVTCPNCQESMIPHQICANCGALGKKSVTVKKPVTITKA